MRIFMDVGAHYGETLAVALDPTWGFDRVYSFEPATVCVSLLNQYRDARIRVLNFGLSDRETESMLYGAGLLGGSVYADKPQYEQVGTEEVHLVRASTWLERSTSAADEIYLKLNCEGSECDILEDLLDSGLIDRVRSIYVDFDAAKIPSQASRAVETESQLIGKGIDYATPATMGQGGNGGVAQWLAKQIDRRDAPAMARLRFRLRLYQPPYLWLRDTLAAVLPRRAFWWVGHRAGRLHGR